MKNTKALFLSLLCIAKSYILKIVYNQKLYLKKGQILSGNIMLSCIIKSYVLIIIHNQKL